MRAEHAHAFELALGRVYRPSTAVLSLAALAAHDELDDVDFMVPIAELSVSRGGEGYARDGKFGKRSGEIVYQARSEWDGEG